jgi:hypothetical protein
MAIDVDDTGIWVIDPNTNTVIVSARLAQVSATPAKHTYYRKSGLTMPVMVVRVPGLQERLGATRPLTIACRERRFSWNTRVPSEPPPASVVSGADWCTLVEKFGLAPYLAVRDQRRFIKAAMGLGAEGRSRSAPVVGPFQSWIPTIPRGESGSWSASSLTPGAALGRMSRPGTRWLPWRCPARCRPLHQG